MPLTKVLTFCGWIIAAHVTVVIRMLFVDKSVGPAYAKASVGKQGVMESLGH